jgi:hypothetical protein
LDLRETLLFLKLKFQLPPTYAAATADVVDKACFPENMIASSMFEKVVLYVNDNLIEGTHNQYHFMSMLMALLQYNEAVLNSQFLPAGYIKTDARRKASMATNTFSRDYAAPIFLSFFQQGKWLLPEMDLRLLFTRAPVEFFMRKEKGEMWKVSIESAFLRLKRVRPAPEVLSAHLRGLQSRNALYPICRTVVNNFTIPTGSNSFAIENLFRGRSPKLIVTAMVKESSITGSGNPFQFENFGLNYFAILQDGISKPNFRAFEPDFQGDNYVIEYLSLYLALQILHDNCSIDISYADFKSSRCIFATNLCADMDFRKGQPLKNSNLRLELKFSAALAANINVIMMAFCDDIVEVDQHRRVLTTL